MPYFYLKDSLFDLTNPYMRNDVYLVNQSRPLRRYTHGRINLQQSSIAMGQTGLHSYVCSQGGDGPYSLGGGLPRQRSFGKFRPMELTAVCSWPKRGFKSMFWRKEGLGCAWSIFPRRTAHKWISLQLLTKIRRGNWPVTIPHPVMRFMMMMMIMNLIKLHLTRLRGGRLFFIY